MQRKQDFRDSCSDFIYSFFCWCAYDEWVGSKHHSVHGQIREHFSRVHSLLPHCWGRAPLGAAFLCTPAGPQTSRAHSFWPPPPYCFRNCAIESAITLRFFKTCLLWIEFQSSRYRIALLSTNSSYQLYVFFWYIFNHDIADMAIQEL